MITVPGDIRFVISGDASVYEKELNRIQSMVDETKRRIDHLYKELKIEDVAVDTMVTETVDKTQVQLSNIRTSVEKESVELDKLEVKRQQTETRIQFTVSGALFGLRSVTDIAALASAITGEQIDVQFLAMISASLTAAMQVQTMAAVYAATPGMQPVALMLLSMLPILTSMVSFIMGEQAKVGMAVDKSIQQNLDSMLDGMKS